MPTPFNTPYAHPLCAHPLCAPQADAAREHDVSLRNVAEQSKAVALEERLQLQDQEAKVFAEAEGNHT